MAELTKKQAKQIESELITLARQMLAVIRQYPEGELSIFIDDDRGYISFFDKGKYGYTEWEDEEGALYTYGDSEHKTGAKL